MRTILLVLSLSAALQLPAAAQESDEPSPPVVQPVETKERPALPEIEIPSRIEETNPQRFAHRLSELVGAEVRLTKKAGTPLTLEAGKRTATEILDLVAKQTDCVWRQEFEFRKRSTEFKPQDCKMGPLAPVTLTARLSVSKAARVISGAAGCKVKLDEVPATLFPLSYEDMQADLALQDLAKRAGRDLWRIVVFSPALKDDEAVLSQEEEFINSLMEQTEQKGRLAIELQELTSLELDDPTFPWEAVLQLLSPADATPDEIDGMLGQIRAEADMMRFIRQTEPDQPFSPAEGFGPPP
jgi:hypothetical protein